MIAEQVTRVVCAGSERARDRVERNAAQHLAIFFEAPLAKPFALKATAASGYQGTFSRL